MNPDELHKRLFIAYLKQKLLTSVHMAGTILFPITIIKIEYYRDTDNPTGYFLIKFEDAKGRIHYEML